MISYSLPQKEFVSIKVIDILGREVATLVNEVKPAGKFEVEFDASSLASGVYVYRIKAGSFTTSKKMLLTK
ncbi:MAG: T9SS type A sorting domain-containing protein [Ignavibacteriales bacterium]|nr:T9SS type A sorting domain-containing protein [Ignavibacteriales bacterium]